MRAADWLVCSARCHRRLNGKKCDEENLPPDKDNGHLSEMAGHNPWGYFIVSLL